MKKLILLLLVVQGSLSAQDIHSDPSLKSKVQKLGFITGQWQGKGWILDPAGGKSYFEQTETVQFKIDSTALLIEGQGKTGAKITHNALAVITADQKSEDYSFRSFLSSGKGGTFRAELQGEKLYWYPNENMRYIIYLNDKGQWYETGEIKREGSWIQFFEMTLDKQ